MPIARLIACVDDDEPVREAIKGLLVALDFTVKTFESGEDFLQFDNLQSVSCLITDLRLGGMSGLELRKALTMSSYDIPTIIITAFGDERMRRRVFSAGAIAFLPKPITQVALISAVEMALESGTEPQSPS